MAALSFPASNNCREFIGNYFASTLVKSQDAPGPAAGLPVAVSCTWVLIWTLANANDRLSVGVSSPPDDPDHWIDSTITSVKSYFRNICCPPVTPVALRITIFAEG